MYSCLKDAKIKLESNNLSQCFKHSKYEYQYIDGKALESQCYKQLKIKNI